jgi:hypothetical protein
MLYLCRYCLLHIVTVAQCAAFVVSSTTAHRCARLLLTGVLTLLSSLTAMHQSNYIYQEEEALLLLQTNEATLSPDHRYLYVEYLPWMGDVVSHFTVYKA